MEAESGRILPFRERLESARAPAYKKHYSITSFLEHSRVQLLKSLPRQSNLHSRVVSKTTGVLLPSSEQPPGTPRTPSSPSMRFKPRGSRLSEAENPPFLVERNRFVSMWNVWPEHREKMVLAKANTVVGVKDDGTVEVSSPAVGIVAGTALAKEMVIPRDDWDKVRAKMRRSTRRFGLVEAAAEPMVEKKQKKRMSKAVEEMEKIAVGEDEEDEEEGEGIGNVLPSAEADDERLMLE